MDTDKTMTSAQHDAGLRECPFCGSSNTMTNEGENQRLDGFEVCCIDCGTDGPLEDSKADAIAAWNRRAPDATLTAANAKLKQLLAQALPWVDLWSREDRANDLTKQIRAALTPNAEERA